jgi:hypothetical protein
MPEREALSFAPCHSFAAHRPLGSIMRAHEVVSRDAPRGREQVFLTVGEATRCTGSVYSAHRSS